jgi:hypothetical protein
MGIFSRKKKLSRDDKKLKEQAHEELKKLKEKQRIAEQEELKKLESQKRSSKESLDKKYMVSQEEHQKLLEQIEQGKKEIEIEQQKNQEKFNRHTDSLRKWEDKRLDLEPEEQTTCGVSECEEEVDFFTGKKCKFCQKRFCFEHIQLEKHECPGPTLARKHLRKTWLRKYDVNISTGKYIVVCDDCGFVSKYGTFIETAGGMREEHIANKPCEPKKVWLEEDLSEQKVEKDIDLESIVPTDRTFWVCAHCRPPQKFTERAEYISHHYFHS